MEEPQGEAISLQEKQAENLLQQINQVPDEVKLRIWAKLKEEFESEQKKQLVVDIDQGQRQQEVKSIKDSGLLEKAQAARKALQEV